jgi:hypothetical protein
MFTRNAEESWNHRRTDMAPRSACRDDSDLLLADRFRGHAASRAQDDRERHRLRLYRGRGDRRMSSQRVIRRLGFGGSVGD